MSTLLLNFLLYLSAAADHSWGTIGIEFFIAPVANLVVMIASTLAGIGLQKTKDFSWGRHLGSSFGIPALAFFATEAAMMLTIHPHGC